MNTNHKLNKSSSDALNDIQFSDLFDLNEIQHLQDLFADTHGVASVITFPDGIPITNPSNFCRLCNDIIRKTGKGRENCFKSPVFLVTPPKRTSTWGEWRRVNRNPTNFSFTRFSEG